MECVKHPGTPIVSVCITCGTALVCVDCMTNKVHTGHVFEKANRISNDIKTKLKQKEAEDCKLEAILKSDLTGIRALETQQHDNQKERVKSINTQREVLIKAVNEMADTFISDYDNQTQKNSIKLQDAIDIVSKQLEKVRRHREEVTRILDEKDDLAVVKNSGNMKDVEVQRKPYPELADINFTNGKVNTQHLKMMFGGNATEINELETLQGAQVPADMTLALDKGSVFVGTFLCQDKELVIKSTFKHVGSKWVSQICCGSNGKSWVRCKAERGLTLIDKQGHVEKTVTPDSGVLGMTTIDNTLLLCGLDDRDIKQVTLPRGNVTSVFSTGKLYPRFVCTTHGADLLMTLTDTIDYNVTANSERVLVRYSPQGQEKGRARYDRRGDDLFVLPSRVRISNTGDIIGVKNGTDTDNGHLVLLNKDLTLRLRYLGNGKVVSGEEKFDTTSYKPEQRYGINDFIFDSSDNIIICEGYSRYVQLLSKHCVPIRTLLPTQGSTPMSMSMNGDDVWLGFNDGTVKVYKYK